MSVPGGKADLFGSLSELRFLANSGSSQPGYDLRRRDQARLRLPGLPLRPGVTHHDCKDYRAVRRTCAPAFRAGAGSGLKRLPVWNVRAELDRMGSRGARGQLLLEIAPTIIRHGRTCLL